MQVLQLKTFQICSHLARSSQYRNKKKQGNIKRLDNLLYFIFSTDCIIQLTRKLMYNDVTEQNLKTCICAILIEVFALTPKNLKNIQIENFNDFRSNFDHWLVTSSSKNAFVPVK